MKRFFLVLGVSVFCVRFVQLAHGALSATPLHTGKGNTGNGAAATSLALTVTAPASGSWCTLVVSQNVATSLTVVQTNVMWEGYPVYQSTGPTDVWIFYGRAFGSAGTTVTIATTNGAAFVAAAVYAEWSGIGVRLDRRAVATGSSTSPLSGATATINSAAELAVGAFGNRGQWSGATTIYSAATQGGTATGGTVSIVDQDNTIQNSANADRAAAMTVQLTTATGTVNMGATIANLAWGAQALTFEENACTPTPTPTPTSTPTATATATATFTPTPSATVNCPVVCPTATATPTATSTSTATPTSTATATSTPTPIINNVIYGQ